VPLSKGPTSGSDHLKKGGVLDLENIRRESVPSKGIKTGECGVIKRVRFEQF